MGKFDHRLQKKNKSNIASSKIRQYRKIAKREGYDLSKKNDDAAGAGVEARGKKKHAKESATRKRIHQQAPSSSLSEPVKLSREERDKEKAMKLKQRKENTKRHKARTRKGQINLNFIAEDLLRKIKGRSEAGGGQR